MQSKIVTTFVALLLLASIPLNVSAEETDDIPTNAAATGVHNSLVAALQHADLVTTLQGDGPFTVFAPTDDAFTAAGIDLASFDTDEENSTLLDILTYHVVSGDVRSSDLTDGMTADALNADKLLFEVNSDGVKVSGASVTTADVVSSNGVIHVIDKVLMPPQDIYVSGGMMSQPYYDFYTDSGGQDRTTSLNLSYSYKFQRLNNANSHPFYISDNGYEGVSSSDVTIVGDGSANSGISGPESFTVFFGESFDESDTLSYYCTVHSNMVSQFNLLPRATPALDDIPTIASSTGIHTSLVAALAKANLVATLEGAGPFTVFAPTDDAFSAAGVDLSNFNSEEEIAALADILTYHVVSGSVLSTDLTDGMVAPALNGDDLSFTVNADGVMVNDANVVSADVIASNGVIHVIDTVLMPPADLVDIPSVASSTGIHTALVAALSTADLVTTLEGTGPFTVFAPTDDAFTAAGVDLSTYDTPEEIASLADILTYHVVAGAVKSTDLTDGMMAQAVNGDNLSFTVNSDGVMVNNANVISADVMASNGVVHVIDAVLIPPQDPVEPEEFDITDVAAGTGVHTALVAALAKADLVTNLQTDGPFTVFAPTDEAFTAAGIDLDAYVTEEEIGVLTDILLYHVVSGAVESSDLTDGMIVSALNEDELSFTVNSDGVMVNRANVTTADVIASNGVIHVIDKVLIPPQDLVDITAIAASTGIHTALVGALGKANLVTTLQGDGPFTVFAPTDDAFAAAGIDLSTFDTDEEIATLVDILTYHVVSGSVMSSDLSDGMTTQALNSDSLTFTVGDGVMVNGANVTLADVIASNGVVHVIDKVLMPPTEEPTVVCDHTVGISAGGLEFSPAAITIGVGDTVCWKWSDESMAHNVVEVDGLKSTTKVAGGISSGTPATTVDFHYTFTEDTTFYYACEPHISVDMFGKVTVGDGGVEPVVKKDKDKKEDNTPGFLGITLILAALGAVLYARKRDE
ncbi:MAG: hypothetical protein CMB16_07270 [Euryarchaeota archaeon]|nr:hypothetical protein [Euryarchaeota archaeon]